MTKKYENLTKPGECTDHEENNTMKEGRRKMKRKLRGTIEKYLRVLCSLMLQKIRWCWKRRKKACKRNKLKIKVVEKIDSTVKGELQRSNPFKVRKCGRENCMIFKQGVKINCRTRGCVYEIKCEECERKYVGQTSRSLYERMNEHFDDWASRREKSMLL